MVLVSRRRFVPIDVEWIFAFCYNSISQRSGLRINHDADRNRVRNHFCRAGIVFYCLVSRLHCFAEDGSELHSSFHAFPFGERHLHRAMKTSHRGEQEREEGPESDCRKRNPPGSRCAAIFSIATNANRRTRKPRILLNCHRSPTDLTERPARKRLPHC